MRARGLNSLVLPTGRTGAVALPSGEWSWWLDLDGDRFRIRFLSTEEPDHEMLAYCRRPSVTAEVVAAHAREPLYRCWTDAQDLRWKLYLEEPNWMWTGTCPEVEARGELTWLVFECETNRRFAWIPRRFRVGELTNRELLRLMENSEPIPLPGAPLLTGSRAS